MKHNSDSVTPTQKLHNEALTFSVELVNCKRGGLRHSIHNICINPIQEIIIYLP